MKVTCIEGGDPTPSTPNMIFSVTYYLDLDGAISFYYWNKILSNEVQI
jgi:hypothetical protein